MVPAIHIDWVREQIRNYHPPVPRDRSFPDYLPLRVGEGGDFVKNTPPGEHRFRVTSSWSGEGERSYVWEDGEWVITGYRGDLGSSWIPTRSL